ncbi:hypothetical protein [Caballeronia mineralivorans]|uniref:hypothetical protein n=1 Tax=Caballeronia mineralivorans TaxID=2010198 RepID=UPI0023F391C6|nr:hypothetical protein [Caballeronia mineralivorans]
MVLCSSCRNVRQIKDSAKVVKKVGIKKTARLRWRFFGKLGFYKNDSPLSIRQRLEMPKKVKIKLGGHDGFGRLGLDKRLAL